MSQSFTPPQALKAVLSSIHNLLVIDAQGIKHQSLSPSQQDTTVEITSKDPLSLHVRFTGKPDNKEPLTILYLAHQYPLDVHVNYTLTKSVSGAMIEYIYGEKHHAVKLHTETTLHQNASFIYTTLSNIEAEAGCVIKRDVILHRDARLLTTHAAFADALTHQETHIHLNGLYASATAKVIALTNKDQEALFKTTIEHHAPSTEGFIEHYGVANDASTLLFEGVGQIHKNMKRSIARQSNKGIIIGDKARLDTNPLLLIDEFDVEASHGATIGKIDEDQLYYLMSRGLSRKQAERLIINGYLSPFKAIIENEALLHHIEALLEHKTK